MDAQHLQPDLSLGARNDRAVEAQGYVGLVQVRFARRRIAWIGHQGSGQRRVMRSQVLKHAGGGQGAGECIGRSRERTAQTPPPGWHGGQTCVHVGQLRTQLAVKDQQLLPVRALTCCSFIAGSRSLPSWLQSQFGGQVGTGHRLRVLGHFFGSAAGHDCAASRRARRGPGR